jgi:hypothetical protein
MIIVIYVKYLYYLGYHIRNKQKNSESGTFAVCHVGQAHGKGPATSSFLGGDFFLPCARYIAHGKGRVYRHLVAVWTLPCAAHGKEFAVCIQPFAVCFGTRQTLGFP